MEINLVQKSSELKELVSNFDSSFFLGSISSMMRLISFENPSDTLFGLTSPLRQLYYLAGLNVTSKVASKEQLQSHFTQEEWEQMKSLLIDIEKGYEQFFTSGDDDLEGGDWMKKRIVAMPSFLSYFNQGPLNYEEQVIERIADYFTPFNSQIKDKFGIEVTDFINIYNFIDSFPNKYLDEYINSNENQPSWEEFAQSMIDKGLRPNQWNEHMPSSFEEKFKFLYDPGRIQRFRFSQIADEFGEEKAGAFLEALVSQREEKAFLYYTEVNILHLRPIFKVGENEFHCLEMKQIAHAIYNLFFEFCTSHNKFKDKFYSVRGDKLENKIERVFQKFFNNRASVYKSYYTTDGHEQDLLFLIDDVALIVEAKASKRKEPRRDPDKAYPLILSNFDEVIQKGYWNCYICMDGKLS